MGKCVCGSAVDLDDAYVLDCKHSLCQGCSRVWSNFKECPACRISAALGKDPVDAQDLVNHLEAMYERYRQLLGEKQSALRKGWKTNETLEQITSERDTLLVKYSQLSAVARQALQMWKSEDPSMEGDKDGNQRTSTINPPRQRKRRRVDTAESIASVDVAGDARDDPAAELTDILRDSQGYLDTLRKQHEAEIASLTVSLEVAQSLCQKQEMQTQELRARCTANSMKLQTSEAELKELKCTNATHLASERDLTTKIADLTSELTSQKQHAEDTRAKLSAFETWARECRTFYKKQIEDLKLGIRSPTYAPLTTPPHRKPSVCDPGISSTPTAGKEAQPLPIPPRTPTLWPSPPTMKHESSLGQLQYPTPEGPRLGARRTSRSDAVRTSDPRHLPRDSRAPAASRRP